MKENSLSHIHLTKEDLVGKYEWKGKLNLFNIIMIGLARELPENNEMYELHRLLVALLSGKLTVGEKLDIIENEYDINIENDLRKDVSNMCNLGYGLVEEGIARGIAEGRAEGRAEEAAGIILKMYNKGFTIEEIAETIDKDVEEVKAIIEGKEAVLAQSI